MDYVTFDRVWAMPNHRTFEIKPVKIMINAYTENLKRFLNREIKILEPFPYEATVDCFDYLDTIPDGSIDLGLIDPPYTKRQISEHYSKRGIKASSWQTSSGWTSRVRKECAKKIRPGGYSITFGYNSCGLGKVNGMNIKGGLMVAHGGDHYDLICTVEQKNR